MMVLQNYTDLGNAVPGPCAETCTTSRDATQAMNIKSEEGSDADEKEDPVQLTLQKIKAEPEVSCISTVREISQICRSANLVFNSISISLSVHMNQVHSVHLVLKSFS
jgi:hypothetical protein